MLFWWEGPEKTCSLNAYSPRYLKTEYYTPGEISKISVTIKLLKNKGIVILSIFHLTILSN
jgi:hypothetical protein